MPFLNCITGLTKGLDAFNIKRLRFYLQFVEQSDLPAFSGSTVHGLLGHCLKATSPNMFNACFAQHDNQHPKPYAIVPDLSVRQHWRVGHVYSFELKLFGDASNYANDFIDAILYGQSLGFGSGKTKFNVLSVTQLCEQGEQPYSVSHSTQTLLSLIPIRFLTPEYCVQVKELTLQFQTPVRIKDKGQIMKTMPGYWLLLKQIIRRYESLVRYWVSENSRDADLLKELLMMPMAISQEDCFLFEDWTRYSKKDKHLLPFGGVSGQLSLHGELANTLPILAIGEQLQIGGKTTFGLGQYQLLA